MRHAMPKVFNGLALPALAAMVAVAWSGTAFSEGIMTGGVMSEGDVNRGATTWANNCTRCHEMRSPTEFRDDIWKPIMAHMRIRAGLTGEQQRDVLAFLQASNSPRADRAALDDSAPGLGLSGKDVYNQTCVACHGANGTGGIPGTPDFTRPDGPLSKSDEDLIRSISNGFQSPGSAMAMPAKGGNPDMNATDVRAVLDYMASLEGTK